MNGRTRDILLAALAVVACLAAYFGFFIDRALRDVGPMSWASSFDFHSYFRPRFWLGSQEILAGRFPLWNLYEWGGLPLLATGQSAALYPPKILLFCLFEPVTAHWIFLVFHYLLFGAGLFLFFHDQGARGPGLFAGAITVLFGTVLLASNYHPVRIACFAWMPFQFLAAEWMGRDRDPKGFPLLALVVALQLVAGYPEFTLDSAVLLTAHAIVSHLVKTWQRPPWVTVPLLALAFVLGGITAGAQLVPLAELASVAHRGAMASHLYEENEATRSVPIPIGTIPALMAFLLVGFWQRRAWTGFAGYATCWLMASGGWLLLRFLPGFSMVRFPFGWVLVALFPFAWVVSLGLDSLTEVRLGKAARRLSLAVVAVTGLGVAVVWPYSWFRSRSGGSSFFDVNIGTPAAVVLGMVGGVTLALVAVASDRWRLRSLWIVPCALLALSHAAAAPHAMFPAPMRPPHAHGLAARLHGRPAEIRGRVLAPIDVMYGYEMTDRIRSPLGIELSFVPHRCRRIMEDLHYLPTFGGIGWNEVARASGFWDMMDVEFVVTGVELEPLLTPRGYLLRRNDGKNGLFRNSGRLGPAWVNYGIRRFDEPERMLAHLLSAEFDPHRAVLVEGPLRGDYEEAGPATPLATPVGSFRRRSPFEVEFTAELLRPGVFVASEFAYPGWAATVDGVPTEWLTVDYILRGIELRPGSHVVRFQYRPWSVYAGVALSFLGLGVIAWLLFRARSRPGAGHA